ncbi:concanavalin A-like lectin/glucanases superfamily protein [Synechococcus sp. SYN20]|uniref:LamG domain-containing protein n=1 Tax=Synechococcus sp. SYN20 TaxID=1050714 RepID=UPI001648E20A|nr:LamG domain-containing protein [Synechococcus sp. SYN20]QNJ25995.1 concanavalin A-like lectin/glucanases superfamily protein [Synechococcus sp. SYN20]
MAKLDQILLKTSNLSQRDLIDTLEGRGRDSRNRIEKGETVLRYTGAGRLGPEGETVNESPGQVEFWTVNDSEEAVQIYVDFGAEIPPWSTSELQEASIGLLKDVDILDGASGGELLLQAGKVLTWDGAKLVLRDPPGVGEGAKILESLNNVGDVNYGFYAISLNKFGPEGGDILLYKFNNLSSKYEWAPTKFEIDLFDEFTTRNRFLVFNRTVHKGIEFGNLTSTATSSARFSDAGGASMLFNQYRGRNLSNRIHGVEASSFGSINLSVRDGEDIVIKLGDGYANNEGKPGALRYERIDDVPLTITDERYFATLKHVNQAIRDSDLNFLNNVNDTGIIQGQVLSWDAIRQEYIPTSGIAPDLSQASIESLEDVNAQAKGRGKPLTWNDTDNTWIPETLRSRDLEWDYNPEGFGNGVFSEDDPLGEGYCEECKEETLGQFTVARNKAYVCLRTRDLNSSTGNFESTYDWVKILVDGYNLTENRRQYAPNEYRQAYGFEKRRDALSPAAYEGTLGSLANVSTADVFPGAAPIYNASTSSFEMGFPALDLQSYSVGALGDVNLTGAGVGYGLLWNGEQWYASSLDQKVRLDDLQDVQFGSLGVTNTKMVAAFMLTDSPALGPTFVYNQDVSTTLAVSTPKDSYFPGSTAYARWGENAFGGGQAPTQGGTYFFNWRSQPPMSVAEILDLYIRWPKDNSWQTIDGDGVIELYFYPTQLLDTRTLFRRVSLLPGTGGYILQLDQTGALRFAVSAPSGEIGFTISTVSNFISTNNWHHVALVKEGASNRMYVDGDLVGEALSTTPWTGDDMFVMGRNDLDDNNVLTHHFFRGVMSDLRVTKGRSKYSGNSYSQPASIEAEIIDTTPNAGDFLSYDGTRWTNVSGVEGDISNKSINELADVDTGTNDPAQGDALVWTGAAWEPGIPGIGATWSLNDMTDVETFYQSGTPSIRFSQAEKLNFSNAFNASDDGGSISQARQGNQSFGIVTQWNDCSHVCGSGSPCGNDGPYANGSTSYIMPTNKGQVIVRAERMTISNVFQDCKLVPDTYHEDALHYAGCPDRGESDGNDLPGTVPETYIPAWGVIQDHVDEILPYGKLRQLGDVAATLPTLGQALAWNGVEWAPTSTIAADVSNNELNDLGNVDCLSAVLDDFLVYDGQSWRNTPFNVQLRDLTDMSVERFYVDEPFNTTNMRNPPRVINNVDQNDRLSDGLISSGYRGMQWAGGASVATHENKTTTLTSGKQTGTQVPNWTWIELNSYFIRFAGHGQNWGSQGLLIGDNLLIRYENQNRDLNDYGLFDVAPKGVLVDYIDLGLANLDLSPNTLEQLGNVDTAGKAPGYALVWDGTNWSASQGVAVDVSLTSVGELRDVTKTENSDLSTNDGVLSFDVGELRTNAPQENLGGIELTNENRTARIGWSGVWGGSPIMANSAYSLLPSFVRVQELEIQVQAAGGLRYTTSPGLTDSTIPAWSQVKQQIARQAADYTALFFMDGNSFTERNYGWPLDVQVTSQPNPQYFSPFADQYSYNLRKINQDKITWSTDDGAPFLWNTDTLWSMEMWVFISASDASDGKLEYILAPKDRGSGQSKGLHIGLCGDQRNLFFFTLDTASNESNRPASGSLTAEGNFDAWNHVYVAHEGSGRHRFYLNGQLVNTIQRNSAFTMPGGLAFGGQENSNGQNANGYLSAALDDIRFTKGWLPYATDTSNVPVPVEPLPPGAWKAVFGSLDALEDVQSSGAYEPSNGQVLQWNNVAKAWRPGPLEAVAYDVSSNSLTDLVDVDTTNSVPDQDDVLRWDAAQAAWRRSKVDGNGGITPLVQRTATPGVIPNPSILKAGELFLNMADQVLYALDSAGEAFAFATGQLDEDGILSAVDTTYDRVVGGTF